MIQIKVRVELKPPDLAARLAQAPGRAAPVLDRMVEDLARQLAYRAKTYAPHQTGALRRSIVPHRVRMADWEVVAVGNERQPYAAFMEFGTRPHWPPPEPIQDWVRRTPWRFGIRGSDERAIRSIGFVVSRAIARRGLAPRRYMQRAFEEIAARAAATVARYAGELSRALAGR